MSRLAALAACLFLIIGAAYAQSEPSFPALTGRIVDEAGLLDAAATRRIGEKLKSLEGKASDQLVVVTLKSLQGYDIAEYGYRLGRHWGIGQRGTNNGVLLIVAPNQRKARIEVGYGLEGTLTDALSRVILDRAILPRFRTGDYVGGIERGVDEIIRVLTGNAEEVAQRLGSRPDPREPATNFLSLLIMFIVITIVLRAFASGSPGVRRGRRGVPPIIFLPGGFGGGGRGGSGGGGFGGGGGTFGGGGSSGEW